MPPEDSSYPKDWLRIAEKDLKRLDLHLKSHDPEAAGFFLQQAVEKLLKAFLLSNGWRLKRIHDLEVLLNEALVYDASLEEYRSVCQTITTYYLIERYPLATASGLKESDIRDALRQVESFISRLRTRLR